MTEMNAQARSVLNAARDVVQRHEMKRRLVARQLFIELPQLTVKLLHQ